MTKGQLIVAMTLGKANREGYPKLTENHPFFGRLRAFMVGKHYRNERYHYAAEYSY